MKRGRKKKIRYVQNMPTIAQFSPRGKAGRPDEAELKIDQFEAIRLADFENCDQTEGAAAMGISRPSFGRILREGRRVLADALVNGKTIRIRIADVQVGIKKRLQLKQKQQEPKELKLAKPAATEEATRSKILKFNPDNANPTA